MGIRAGHKSPRLCTQLRFVWVHSAVVSSHHVLISELTAFLAGLRPPWGPSASQFTGGTTHFPWGRAEQQGEGPSLMCSWQCLLELPFLNQGVTPGSSGGQSCRFELLQKSSGESAGLERGHRCCLEAKPDGEAAVR